MRPPASGSHACWPFIDAHQDQRWIEGNGGKGVGCHAVFDIAVTGGHHRHTRCKTAQYLSKQHRIKWHNPPPGQLPHSLSYTWHSSLSPAMYWASARL